VSGPFADAEDERIRSAFQRLGETASAEDVDVERVWRAVTGELPPEDRREVVERVAADPSWALAWRLAHELRTASAEPVVPRAVGAEWKSRLRYAALAAAVLLALGIGLLTRDRSGPPVNRGARAPVQSLVPDGGSLPRRLCLLRWTGPAGATYDVNVKSEDMERVHTAVGLTTPRYRVPEEFVSAFPPGARLLWQVHARLPDGTVAIGDTFVATLE
jgi:hypothetical protein